MKGKRLTNLQNPEEDSEVSIKAFVLQEVEIHRLTIQYGKASIYAKDKCTGSVTDPKYPKNVVTKSYLEDKQDEINTRLVILRENLSEIRYSFEVFPIETANRIKISDTYNQDMDAVKVHISDLLRKCR